MSWPAEAISRRHQGTRFLAYTHVHPSRFFFLLGSYGLATECLPSSSILYVALRTVMDTDTVTDTVSVCMYYITVPQLLRYDVGANQTKHEQVMHPSFRVAHKPLISFIGKRQWLPGKFPTPPGVCFVFKTVTGPQPQRPHPAAPTQFKEAFSDFLEKYKNLSFPSTSSSNEQSSGRPIFNEFWDAPEYLWQPKVRKLEDLEIDAVLVSRNSFGLPFFWS